MGGLGKKKSNGGTQYYQQDRVYYGDIALCIPASLPGGSYMYIIRIGNIYGATGGSYAGSVYGKNGLAPTIKTFQGGNQQPHIVVNSNTKSVIPMRMWLWDGYNKKIINHPYIGTITTAVGNGNLITGWKVIIKKGETK